MICRAGALLGLLGGCTNPTQVPPPPGSDTSDTGATAAEGSTAANEGTTATAQSATGSAEGTSATGSATTDSADSTTAGSEDSTGTTGSVADCHPMLVEVYYDTDIMDDEQQWIRLYSDCPDPVDLSAYVLEWSTADDMMMTLALAGSMERNACFIVGGPDSIPENADPDIDQAVDLDPNIYRDGNRGRRVALFDVPAGSITPETPPIEALIFGDNNDGELLDATGTAPATAQVKKSGNAKSLRRTAPDTWEVSDPPEPDLCPPF